MPSLLGKLLGRDPEGLLFDLEGTLVDSVPDLAVAINAMLMAANLPLAGEPQVRDWVGNGAKVLVEHALAFAYQCDRAEVARDELRYQYQQFLVFYRESSSQQSHLYKGVAPALQHWRRQGLKMAVVTNKPAEFITPLLERFNLQDYFSVLVGGDTLLQQKPDPAPIQYACKELDLSVDQCIMIGDSCTDVGAARAANMTVACVSYGYNHGVPIEETRPDIVVDSLSDLIV